MNVHSTNSIQIQYKWLIIAMFLLLLSSQFALRPRGNYSPSSFIIKEDECHTVGCKKVEMRFIRNLKVNYLCSAVFEVEAFCTSIERKILNI